jgi:hypothetical protein
MRFRAAGLPADGPLGLRTQPSLGEASSPGSLARQRATPDLPYGLDVWHGAKVLSIVWADDGAFEVISFVRGQWEDEALAL